MDKEKQNFLDWQFLVVVRYGANDAVKIMLSNGVSLDAAMASLYFAALNCNSETVLLINQYIAELEAVRLERHLNAMVANAGSKTITTI